MVLKALYYLRKVNKMPISSGIFTQAEFKGREVLKLAPDAFVSINGALGARIVAPVDVKGTQSLEMRGGVTSINVNGAIKPSGASRATIEVIAPQYKGLHEDYYVSLPNGTRTPYFVPMMEIVVYMKGRYMVEDNRGVPRPKYYPVFWGMILEVSENYSGGVSTFSLNCGDVLSWFKYQKINVKASAQAYLFGSPVNDRVPTVFENLNPWEIIMTLFVDSFFQNLDDKRNPVNTFSFVYPKLSKTGIPPDFEGITNKELRENFGGLALSTMNYWNNRFGWFNTKEVKDKKSTSGSTVPLEMYGLKGPLDATAFNSIRSLVDPKITQAKKKNSASVKATLDLDFGILAKIQPFGALSLYGDSGEPLVQNKLDIANEVCEQTQMEFFVDMNGSIVFKPPFYNLNVISDAAPEYTVDAKDVINFNASVNSENIVNFLECTAPAYYNVPEAVELIGYHIDYDSIARYGLRNKSVALRYGNSKQSLRLIAGAEMARMNGTAYTGSVSIPLRPEMRLGYPVYIAHIDTFYYVTGVSHSFTFGSAATTTLSLEFRRERVFDDGTVTNTPGTVLKGYVQRYRKKFKALSTDTTNTDVGIQKKIDELIGLLDGAPSEKDAQEILNLIEKQKYMMRTGIVGGPQPHGNYFLDKASLKGNPNYLRIGGDHALTGKKVIKNPKTGKLEDSSLIQDAVKANIPVLSNELLMITDETIPYTDINGYRHIGAFPYGANLVIVDDDGTLEDFSLPKVKQEQATKKQINDKKKSPPSKPKSTPKVQDDPVNEYTDLGNLHKSASVGTTRNYSKSFYIPPKKTSEAAAAQTGGKDKKEEDRYGITWKDPKDVKVFVGF